MTESEPGWLDPSLFPACSLLEHSFAVIRAELLSILDQNVWMQWGNAHYTPTFTRMSSQQIRGMMAASQSKIGQAAEPSWQLFGIYLRGQQVAENATRCPKTAAVLSQIPQLMNGGFSCLEAGYRTKPHIGHDRSFYRIHLPLLIPAGNVGMTVSGVTRRWEEGKAVIFDDTCIHTAWNESSEHRYVLIADIANGRPRAP